MEHSVVRRWLKAVTVSRVRASVQQCRAETAAISCSCKPGHATRVDDIKVFIRRFHSCALSMATDRCVVPRSSVLALRSSSAVWTNMGVGQVAYPSSCTVGVDVIDFPTLANEAKLDAFFLSLTRVVTATCRTKLDLADTMPELVPTSSPWLTVGRLRGILGKYGSITSVCPAGTLHRTVLAGALWDYMFFVCLLCSVEVCAMFSCGRASETSSVSWGIEPKDRNAPVEKAGHVAPTRGASPVERHQKVRTCEVKESAVCCFWWRWSGLRCGPQPCLLVKRHQKPNISHVPVRLVPSWMSFFPDVLPFFFPERHVA